MEPVYVVAGSVRSTTTMTMGAILAGSSLRPAYTPGRAELLRDRIDDEDFSFNPDELYELVPCEACHAEICVRDNTGEDHALIECADPACFFHFCMEPHEYRGHLIKRIIVSEGWSYPKCDYKAVFLVREHEEIRQSAGNALGGPFVGRDEYCSMILGTFMDARRQGVDARLVWARDLVENAEHEFGLLAADGWPIDPVAAAKHVRPESFRCKVEDLTEGMVCV